MQSELVVADGSGAAKKGGQKRGFMKGKDGTKELLKITQRSSASMGKFDRKVRGEKRMDRGGKRQKKIRQCEKKHKKTDEIVKRSNVP